MSHPIADTFRALGPLRIGLALMAIVAVALMPAPGSDVATDGWGIFTGIVVPALTPLLIVAYGLDLLMTLIFMKDRAEAERRRYRWVVASDLALMALLLAVFAPLILALRR